MRRRLSVSCAMVAQPVLAILDEPTTGLDPISRRGIWDAITDTKQRGGCCLLTTHLLEEAEALCSYLVILKKGVVLTEGSVQKIKEEGGKGYHLTIDREPGKEESAKNFMDRILQDNDRTP